MARLVTCPNCGAKFDIMYARTHSCKGCVILATRFTCSYIKCPYCGYEFSIG